jgi:hypothetical protein
MINAIEDVEKPNAFEARKIRKCLQNEWTRKQLNGAVVQSIIDGRLARSMVRL